MMFKLVTRLMGIVVVAGLILLALSMWEGGQPFRWIGIKSQQAGEAIRKRSEELGEAADKIRKKAGSVRNVTERVTEGIEEAGTKIENIAGGKKK
jgi:methyl-accepting chemotaxis protein